MLKQAAQMAVTSPTSRSFFLRPRLSMGKRCSIRNSRPPYTTKPTAAATDTTATKVAEQTRAMVRRSPVSARLWNAQRPP
jgi:hypothetical protein